MPTQTKDSQQPPAADTAAQQGQDLMIQLVRHGQDASLRSLQLWADLARQLGPSALRPAAAAAMLALAYDLLERLLVAQRGVVDELVAAQRQFAKQFFDTATSGKFHADADGPGTRPQLP